MPHIKAGETLGSKDAIAIEDFSKVSLVAEKKL